MATQGTARHKPGADPAQVDPRHYKVEFENDRVRVLRITFGPHEKSVMHSHPDLIGILLSDHHSLHRFPDGRTEEMKGKTGDIQYLKACEHDPSNLSDKPLESIAVELKK